MSSIDKYMEDIACGYDRRVRVSKTSYVGYSGYICFYIGRECILRIPDRYGIINDSERNAIRNAIQNYQARERREAELEEQRRREEAERRRREEEERRRREEEERQRRLEAERVAAYNAAVSSVESARHSVESAYATIVNVEQALSKRISDTDKLLSTARFDTSAVKARLRALDGKNKTGLAQAMRERDTRLAGISRYGNIDSRLSTERYKSIKREVDALSGALTSVSFDRDGISSIEQYAKELVAAHNKLFKLRERFVKDSSLNGVSGEIAMLSLRQIDETDKNSLEEIESLLVRLEDAQARIEQGKSEAEIFGIIETLQSVKGTSHVETEFIPRQSTYNNVDYDSQCRSGAEQLRSLYETLKNSKHTTATQHELDYIERTLQEFSVGVAGKGLLDSINEMITLVRGIIDDDVQCAGIFGDYDEIKERLAAVGVVADELNAFDYDAQREKLLDTLCAKLAEIEADKKNEESEDKRNMLAFGLRSAFASQGLYFVSGRVSEKETAEENVFAIPGVDDVVIKAVVTEDSLHWFVCGTEKEDGTTTSAERVLEVMRELDCNGKPQEILNALSQFLQIQSGDIMSAIDCDSENALEKIVTNGTFPLSQELTREDGTTVTAGSVLREISEYFASEAEANRIAYAQKDSSGHTEISKTQQSALVAAEKRKIKKIEERLRIRERTVTKPKPRGASALRARYKR